MIDWRIIESDARSGVTEAGSRVRLRQTLRGWWAWSITLPSGTQIAGEPMPTPETAARCAELAEREHMPG